MSGPGSAIGNGRTFPYVTWKRVVKLISSSPSTGIRTLDSKTKDRRISNLSMRIVTMLTMSSVLQHKLRQRLAPVDPDAGSIHTRDQFFPRDFYVSLSLSLCGVPVLFSIFLSPCFYACFILCLFCLSACLFHSQPLSVSLSDMFLHVSPTTFFYFSLCVCLYLYFCMSVYFSYNASTHTHTHKHTPTHTLLVCQILGRKALTDK